MSGTATVTPPAAAAAAPPAAAAAAAAPPAAAAAAAAAAAKPKKKTPPIILAERAVGRQTKQLSARTGIDERVQGNMVAYLTGLQAYVGARALARFADPENLPSQDSIFFKIYAEGKQTLAAQDFDGLLDGLLGTDPEGGGEGDGGSEGGDPGAGAAAGL